MIVVKLKGGLGNQMFQYAIGRNLSIILGKKLFLELGSFEPENVIPSETPRKYELGIFNFNHLKAGQTVLKRVKGYQNSNLVGKIFNRIFPSRQFKIIDDHNAFSTDELKRFKVVLIDGYFQSENYFIENAHTIRQDFEFPKETGIRNLEMKKKITGSDAVSVHVRRGDYVSNASAFIHHGVCSREYYDKAIQLMKNSAPEAPLFYFTDDVDWVRTELMPMFPGELVSDANRNAHDDLFLMSCCKHHIISNSSFSWWGAWLGGRIDSKTIAPMNWYANKGINISHLIPSSWIQI